MDENKIHSTVIIEGDVKLGKGNKLLPYTVLIGPLEIGDNNIIGPSVAIGGPGQDTRNPRYDSSKCRIVIGSNNIIREFTGIQKPCYQDVTRLGNGIHLMQSVHIPHDAILEDQVVITPMVAMGGIVRILEGANLGMGCTVHQYSVIGQYSIVATGAPVLKNVKPFSRYIPGKPISVNAYAVEKYGFSEHLDEITAYILRNEPPASPRVRKLIDHYQDLHRQSEREQY